MLLFRPDMKGLTLVGQQERSFRPQEQAAKLSRLYPHLVAMDSHNRENCLPVHLCLTFVLVRPMPGTSSRPMTLECLVFWRNLSIMERPTCLPQQLSMP